jgi:hypothetical protein
MSASTSISAQVERVQLTATLPFSFSHDPPNGWERGTGDVELGVKYQFLHDDVHGFSAAVFPRVIRPGSGRTSLTASVSSAVAAFKSNAAPRTGIRGKRRRR